MYTFLDHYDNEYGAIATIEVTNAVNGEKSIKGEIYSNDNVLQNIDKGWRLRFQNEYFVITYAKPKDIGNKVQISFDAVHQFFWDFSKMPANEQLPDGSHTFQAYLEFIFKGTDYRYNLEQKAKAFEKQSFGYKSKLALFNNVISTAGVEFQVNGKVVRILEKTGTDLSTVVRKNFNMNDLTIEKNIDGFITYQRGFGAWNDKDDHSKGRLEIEYESPLAKEFGRLGGEPVVDERYTDSQSLLSVLKSNVENSYTISVQIDMEDLTRAGYRYDQPVAGDYIMAINETLGFQEKIRIVSYTSQYDAKGTLISHKVTCNDIGSVKKQSSSYTRLSKSVSESNQQIQDALIKANNALVTADGKNTSYFGTEFPEDVPKGTLTEGDIFYRTVGDRTLMYFWNGSDWEDNPVLNDVEEFKRDINQQFDEFNESYEAEQAKQDQAVKEVLAKANTAENLADEAKRVGDQAKLDAANALSSAQAAKNEAIEEAQRLDTIVRQDTETKLATAKSQAVAEADKLVNDAKTTLETEISNANQSIAEAKEALESQISGVSTEVTKTNDTIKTLATKTDVDSTNKRLTSAETTIKQQAGQIAQKANQSAVDMLSGRVTKAETSLTQQADEIALKANTSDVNTLTNRVTKAEASVKVNASQIALKASQTEVDSVKSRLQNAESSLTVQANEIASRVKTSDFNQAKQRLATAESKITQLGDKITTEISEVEGKIPTSIGGRNLWIKKDSTGASTIEQLPQNHITGQTECYRLENGAGLIFNIEPEFSSRLYGKVTFTAWVKYENVVQGANAWNVFNCFKHVLYRKNSNTGATSKADYMTLKSFTGTSDWQKITVTYDYGQNTNYDQLKTQLRFIVEQATSGTAWVTGIKVETGTIATDYSLAPEDLIESIKTVKTTINQTARGQEQLSTQLTQAQGKITKAETQINQLIGEVSSKVSQTVFDRLNNTVSSQATTLSQQANQILLKADKSYVDTVNKLVSQNSASLSMLSDAIEARVLKSDFDTVTGRVTSAETTIKAIAGQIDTKLSRTDADKIVTNAITQSERGTIQRISEVEGKIPTSVGGRNLLLNSDFEKVATGNSFTVDGQVYDTTAEGWTTYNSSIANAKTSYHAYVADYAGRKNAVIYNESNGSRNWKGISQNLSDRMPQTTNNFILSADVFVTGAGTRLIGGFRYADKTGSYNFHSGYFRFDTNSFEVGKWQRVSIAVPFEKDKADFSKDIRFYIYAYNFSTNAILAIDDVKLETGKIPSDHTLAPEELAKTAAVHEIQDTVDSHTRTIAEQGKSISQVVQTAEGLVSRVENVKSGISTVQSQLTGSWAVKNLTSAGTVLNQINLMANGTNRIDGRLTHITGSTLIDNAVIKDAHIASVSASKMTTGTLDAGKVNVINLNANKIAGLDANFIKAKIESAMIEWLKGKTISAQNDAMKINLNSGQMLYYTDQAAIKRILSGYPTQFVKFATGTVSGKGLAGVTVIGSNRNGTESSNDGGFVGIRAWNGSNIDSIDVVGDTVRLASSAFDSADGWDVITLPNRLEIDAHNVNHRVSSKLKVGDVWLWKNTSTYSSLKETINLIIDNLQLLHNNKTTEKGYRYSVPTKV